MGRRAAIKARQRNRRILTIAVVVGIVAMVVVLTLIAEADSKVQGDQYSSSIGQPVSPSMLQELYGVSDSTLSAIGIPSSVTPPTPTKSVSPLLTFDGKPEVLYIGGDFCPFCALEPHRSALPLRELQRARVHAVLADGRQPQHPDLHVLERLVRQQIRHARRGRGD